MTYDEAIAFLVKQGLSCICNDCDIEGCLECIICKINEKETIEIANRLKIIAMK